MIRLLSRTTAAGMLASLLVSTSALAQSTTFSQKPFTDVPKTHVHYEALEYLRTHNVLKGYPDGTFKPDRRITRGEFVKLIMNPFLVDADRLSSCLKNDAKVEAGDKVFFTDVTTTDWFAAEVCLAKVTHVIDGYPDGTFKPLRPITFAEAAKIVSHVFSLETDTDPNDEFWYRPYTRRLSELKAIPTSISRVTDILTRGEMAEIVFRLKADRTNKPSSSF